MSPVTAMEAAARTARLVSGLVFRIVTVPVCCIVTVLEYRLVTVRIVTVIVCCVVTVLVCRVVTVRILTVTAGRLVTALVLAALFCKHENSLH